MLLAADGPSYRRGRRNFVDFLCVIGAMELRVCTQERAWPFFDFGFPIIPRTTLIIGPWPAGVYFERAGGSVNVTDLMEKHGFMVVVPYDWAHQF